jgi:hypothetical protein
MDSQRCRAPQAAAKLARQRVCPAVQRSFTARMFVRGKRTTHATHRAFRRNVVGLLEERSGIRDIREK